ncbi:hypothetical protein ACJX0J_023587, partial [Zea mays]
CSELLALQHQRYKIQILRDKKKSDFIHEEIKENQILAHMETRNILVFVFTKHLESLHIEHLEKKLGI